MKESEALAELSSIRSLMERSAKFISLSGISGVMAGIYALIGAFFGYRIVHQSGSGLDYGPHAVNDQLVITQLSVIGAVVLLCSVATAIVLSTRKAKQRNQQIWNAASKGLLVHAGIPLITGGLLIFIFLYQGYIGIIASTCLIFYGLALVSGSHYTFKDIKWLGFSEILLGLLATLMPAYGLLFWSVGFGILHIIYGLIMYYKYDSSK
jgi:hypothetical protein